MKKIYFTLIFLSFLKIAFAQTNTFPASGNVGVGTTNPTEAIEATGNVKLSGSGNYFLQLGGGTNGQGGYLQGTKQSGGAAGYGIWANHNAVWDGTNWIQPRGTVSSSLFSANHHMGFIWFYATAGGVNGAAIQPQERMRLNTVGRLGLGTGSVIAAKLHVVDTLQQLRLGYDAANYNTFVTGSKGNLTIASYGTNPSIAISPAGTGSILLNANVGIGTSSPAEKLSVNGNIRAKEIKVEIANWPDFVFAKDYKLPSIQETENHIKEKGHLPGIPSAKEAEKNGIEVGEMNKKLLQKIEELTLYLIEQKRQIQTLNDKVETLQKRIDDDQN